MAASIQSLEQTKQEREPLRKWLDVLYAIFFYELVLTLLKSEGPVKILKTYRITEEWRGAFGLLVIVLFAVCVATIYIIERFYSRLSKLQWSKTLNESQQFKAVTTWSIRVVAGIWLLLSYQWQTIPPFTKMFLVGLVVSLAVSAIAFLLIKWRYQE